MFKKWFTLVELIVVITILVILWSIAFISMQRSWDKAEAAVQKNSMLSIVKSLTLYSQEVNKFPEATDSDWTRLESWIKWYLNSNSSFWKFFWNFDKDHNWLVIIWWKKVFYALDASWKYYAIWIELTWMSETIAFIDSAHADWAWKALIMTNYPVSADKFTLLWTLDWELDPTFVVLDSWNDSNSNWIIERSEAAWFLVDKWFYVSQKNNWDLRIVVSDWDVSSKPALTIWWNIINPLEIRTVWDEFELSYSWNVFDIDIRAVWYNNWESVYLTF